MTNGRSERALQQVGHSANQFRDIDGLLLKLLTPREGQHPLGQHRAALRALNRVVEQRHEFGIVGQALAHQFEAAEHDHQQIVEVVGDPAGELPDRLHFLRLQQGLARRFELLLSVLPLGDVAGDLGVADQLAVVVADGVDDDVSPKAGAILADAPAFFFKSPLSLDGFQRLLRLAGLPIFIRVEFREVRCR